MGRKVRGPAQVKPWHRAVAWAGLVAAGPLAVWSLATVDADRTSWAKHVFGATLAIVALGGLCGAVAAPRPTGRVLVAIGWTLPVALLWVGVEHWVNWFAFYDSRGRHKITSEAGARVQGSFLIALGVGGLLITAVAWRELLRDRRLQRRA